MKEATVPTFAIVGQPNNGKTTVIATLAEIDSARISPVPGTTLRCTEYAVTVDEAVVIRFVDTPGFEEAAGALEWFEANALHHKNPAAAFIAEFADKGLFERECEILKPIAQNAVVIYVIDGSIPLAETNRFEMRLLQLVGNPRVAVINSKEPDVESMETWKPTLNQLFNGYHIFNGHRATFVDRINLLENIKGRFPDWSAQMDCAIRGLERDWNSRLNKVANAMCDLLASVMNLRERVPTGDGTVDGVALVAQERLRKAVQQEEERYRRTVRLLFKHSSANWLIPPHSVLAEDLFSDRVWKMFGLSKLQLAAASAIIGGGLGAYIDVHLGGASMMLGLLVGAGAGALIGYMGASQGISISGPQLKLGPLSIPSWNIKAGENYAEARARTQSNLPWILVDRALLYFQLASSCAHGLQSGVMEVDDDARRLGALATQQWDSKARGALAGFLKVSRDDANSSKREAAQKELWQCLRLIASELTLGVNPGRGVAGSADADLAKT